MGTRYVGYGYPGRVLEYSKIYRDGFWIEILVIFGFEYPVFSGRVSTDTRIPTPSCALVNKIGSGSTSILFGKSMDVDALKIFVQIIHTKY